MIHTSLIIPVYNAEAFLDLTIKSILGQTDKQYEVIFVDDESTDSSVEIIKGYMQSHDNFYLIKQKHSYQGVARNRGLEVATGEYICFLDADDMISFDLIDTCYRACKAENAELVFFDMEEFTEDGAFLYEHFGRDDLGVEEKIWDGCKFFNRYWKRGGVFLSAGSYYVRKSFLMRYNIRFGEGYYYEDNEWALQLLLNAHRARYIHRKLYKYRRRLDSSSQCNNWQKTLKSYMKTLFRFSQMYSDFTDDFIKAQIVADIIMMRIREIIELVEMNIENDTVFDVLTEHMELKTEQFRYADNNMDIQASLVLRLFDKHVNSFPDRKPGVIQMLETIGIYYGFFEKKTIMYGCGKRAAEWLQIIESIYARKPDWIPMQTESTFDRFNGSVILSPDSLLEINPDNIIITSSKNSAEIRTLINSVIKECNIRTLW